jgi:hypothetical protein
MEANLTKIWATPSTLHLRLLVRFKTHQGVQFLDLHIPLADIPADVKATLTASEGVALVSQDQAALF